MVGNWVKCSVLMVMLLQGLPVLAAQKDTFTVVRVIDGDTCVLENGERVRYLGINAPEEGDPYFEEATQANHNLVAGKEVRLEPQDPARDRGGRLLAYVFVSNVFVNEELVRQGYAHVQRPPRAEYRNRLLMVQRAAWLEALGIWVRAAGRNVAIAEIHPDPEGKDRENLCDEYIVIENREDTPLDLTAWTVSDEANHRYLFPNFTLKAKAAVTLRTCSGRNTESELFWGSRNSIWNNDGDTIFVRDTEGELAVSLIY
ncbi:MAG: lamin tail domain-containing protein [Candidatus Aerophobetes bacterium]